MRRTENNDGITFHLFCPSPPSWLGSLPLILIWILSFPFVREGAYSNNSSLIHSLSLCSFFFPNPCQPGLLRCSSCCPRTPTVVDEPLLLLELVCFSALLLSSSPPIGLVFTSLFSYTTFSITTFSVHILFFSITSPCIAS